MARLSARLCCNVGGSGSEELEVSCLAMRGRVESDDGGATRSPDIWRDGE